MAEISVIVPVYNAENYLCACIDSILAQTYKDFELILVDDGSTDGSGAICDEYAQKDSRVRVFHKANGGVSSARNMGLDNARRNYCVFIDADDELNTDTFLEELLKCAEYDYVVGGLTHCIFVDGVEQERKRAVLSEREGITLREMPDEFFINGFIHTCCGKLYRREIIEKNHLRFEPVRLSEDSLFNVNYLKAIQSWKTIEHAGYSYIHRKNGENATAKVFQSDIDVYVKLYQRLNELPVKKSVIRKTMYAQFLALCLRTIKNPNATREQKRSDLKYILCKPNVRATLLSTMTTAGEWLTGIVVCTGSLRLYSVWTRFVEARGR